MPAWKNNITIVKVLLFHFPNPKVVALPCLWKCQTFSIMLEKIKGGGVGKTPGCRKPPPLPPSSPPPPPNFLLLSTVHTSLKYIILGLKERKIPLLLAGSWKVARERSAVPTPTLHPLGPTMRQSGSCAENVTLFSGPSQWGSPHPS